MTAWSDADLAAYFFSLLECGRWSGEEVGISVSKPTVQTQQQAIITLATKDESGRYGLTQVSIDPDFILGGSIEAAVTALAESDQVLSAGIVEYGLSGVRVDVAGGGFTPSAYGTSLDRMSVLFELADGSAIKRSIPAPRDDIWLEDNETLNLSHVDVAAWIAEQTGWPLVGRSGSPATVALRGWRWMLR